MEFDKTFYTHKQKMATLQVPSISEVKKQLGEDLSVIFFNSCPESLLKEMSLDSMLKGAGVELWMSPSDILIDKVVLKPPLTNRHMKALTHEGILDIGVGIEKKLLEKLEAQKHIELLEQQELLQIIAERERERAVSEAVMREHELFKLKLMQLNEEFDILLHIEMTKLEDNLKEVYEKMFDEKIEELVGEQEEETMQRIEVAVNTAVETLTAKFLEDLDVQEAELTSIFNLKLEGQREKYESLLKNEQDVFAVLLKQLKHNLQCNNISNLMYVLCTERRKCLQEKQMLVDYYDEEISKLNKTIRDNEEKIEKVTEERNEKQKQCDVRERFLVGVITQFQKFINFALRATPTQAEFLLSVEKMMTFELTQAVAMIGHRDRLCKKLMPWRTRSKVSEEAPHRDMEANDFHNCLKEMPMPKSSRESQQSLRAFTYDEHLYVREDFRNQVSQGFLVRPSSMVWHSDVANLIRILRQANISDQPSPSSPTTRSPTSSVHFNYDIGIDEVNGSLLRQDSANVGLLAVQDSVALQKSIKSHHSSHYSSRNSVQDDAMQYTAVTLLGIEDSLMTIKNANLLQKIEEVSNEGDPTKTQKTSKMNSNMTLQLSDPKDKSRYSEARESVQTLNLGEGQKKAAKDVFNIEVSPISVNASESMLKRNEKRHDKKVVNNRRLSKLSLHRNSLHLLREEREGIKNDPTRQVKEVVRLSIDSHKSRNHMVVNIPKVEKKVDINFRQVASLYTELVMKDNPWKMYDKPKASSVSTEITTPKRDNFRDKCGAAKVLGGQGREHLQSSNDFTVHRLHSIVDMLKKDDSLIRIFTGCGQ